MIGIAITNYFYPLITGQLKLIFNTIEINKSNVREHAKKYAADRFGQIDELFDFIEQVYKAEQETILQLKSSWIKDNKIGEDDFEPDELEKIRRKFINGELVALCLPVIIKRKDGNDEYSKFSIYLKI